MITSQKKWNVVLVIIYVLYSIILCTFGKREILFNCPSNCVCRSAVVNCSYSSILEFPQDLPVEVTDLYITNSKLGEIQPATIPYLPNLNVLTVKYSQLNKVKLNPKNVPNLKLLDLSFNLLQQLPKGLPAKLVSLLLGHNKIEDLQSDCLEGLIRLQEIFLDNNKLVKLCFNNSELDKSNEDDLVLILPSLEKMAFSYNAIRNIDRNFFKGLIRLKTLSLDSNKLKHITSKIFKNLFELSHLDLSGNLLNNIDEDALKKLNNLEYLDLHNNRLTTMPVGLPMMEWIDLSYNLIRTISQDYMSVLLPINTFNFAHNPFHCDCNLKWLKELFVRREYIVKHLSIDKFDFIPYCESPKSLSSKMWDVLTDDDFVCTNDTDQVLHNDVQDKDFKPVNFIVKVDNIGDTYIQITWTNKNKHTFNTVIIQYYQFGDRDASLKHVEISTVQKEFRIKHLIPETNYVVCVIPKFKDVQNGQYAVPLAYNHCQEVTTIQLVTVHIGSYLWIFCYYILGMAGTVAFIVLVIALVALICTFVPKRNEQASENMPVIDEPIVEGDDSDDYTGSNSSENCDLKNRGFNSKFTKIRNHKIWKNSNQNEFMNEDISKLIGGNNATTKKKKL